MSPANPPEIFTRRHNIRTVFRAPPTLRHQLCRIKDRDPMKRSCGVRDPLWLWPDLCWRDQEGTGDQTEAASSCHKKRRNGKVSNCRTCLDPSTSACLVGDQVLDHAGNTNIRKMKEAIHISLRNENELMNRDQGVEIDGWWKGTQSRPDLEPRTNNVT